MRQFMIVDAVKYALGFIQEHFWALLKMLLVFMAIAIAVGLIVTGSSIILLGALSNNMWLTVALESPLLAVVGFIVYGVWNVSFITYLLALERTGSAVVAEQLKKSWSLRVLKIMLFDLLIVLFLGMIALVLGGVALGTWWFGGMQIALWLRIVLGVIGALSLAACVYIFIRLCFTKIVIADTNTDMFTALSVSWSATQGWFWRLILMGMVLGVFGGIVSSIASYLAQLILFLVGGSVYGVSLGALIGNTLQVFVVILNIVFGPIVILYYYLHLKVVKSLVAGK